MESETHRMRVRARQPGPWLPASPNLQVAISSASQLSSSGLSSSIPSTFRTARNATSRTASSRDNGYPRSETGNPVRESLGRERAREASSRSASRIPGAIGAGEISSQRRERSGLRTCWQRRSEAVRTDRTQ
eukprot:9325837-Pyramimonas_sp.AAC.1